MKGFIGTLIGGAIACAALYAVGKIAFHAGYDIAEAECRYDRANHKEEAAKEENDISEEEENEKEEAPVQKKSSGKMSMLFGLRKLFSKNGSSTIGNLLQNPEDHVIEACVKGREIHVNVRPKAKTA